MIREYTAKKPRLFRKSPLSALERETCSPGKDGDLSGIALATTEAGDSGSIVGGDGCSQAEEGLLEARATSPTEPIAAIMPLLFPHQVITEEVDPKHVHEAVLPEEAMLVRNASAKRRQEFKAGRVCARKALAKLGKTSFPVLAGKKREPLWPVDCVGSISHTAGFCGAAVANKLEIAGLGFDVERVQSTAVNTWEYILTRSEFRYVESLPLSKQRQTAYLMFSAKECFYKCLYPIVQQWVDFLEVTVSINPCLKSFTLRFLRNGRFNKEESFRGKYLLKNSFVFTGMTLFHHNAARLT